MENLRRVVIKLYRTKDIQKYGEQVEGYFHKFISVSNEDWTDEFALCELKDGTLIKVDTADIKFLNEEEKE